MSHVEGTNRAMIGGIVIDKVAYADDIDTIAGFVAELQTKADNVKVVTGTFGMKINEDKPKGMCMSKFNSPYPPKAEIE